MGADRFKILAILEAMVREGLLSHELSPPAKGRVSAKRWRQPPVVLPDIKLTTADQA